MPSCLHLATCINSFPYIGGRGCCLFEKIRPQRWRGRQLMEIHSCSPPQTSATLCPRNTVCKAYWSPDKTAGSFPLYGSTFTALRVEPSTFLQQWRRLQYCCCNFAWRILLLPVKTDMHFIISSTFTLKGHWDAADHRTVWLQFITTSFQNWPKRGIKEQYSTTSSKPIFTYCKFKFAAFSIKLMTFKGLPYIWQARDP